MKIISSVKETAKNAGKTESTFIKDNARIGILSVGLIAGGYALSGETARGGKY